MYAHALLLAAAAAPALAAIAQNFSQPAASPFSQSSNYTGAANSTLQNGPVVPGKVFDRFIQIWLENTDFETAASSPVFQNLAKQGILLTNYFALTHPSEPNYCAAAGGDFWGMGDDAFYAIPSNISTIVDLLEAKNVSWASYQENLPFDGFTGFNYTQPNYLNASAGNYTYYVRKHNPVIYYDSVMGVQERGLRVRNFNDFALDASSNTLPQWMFITPNIVDDAHDTTIDFASDWLSYWLPPLLANDTVNTNRTLFVISFDENETETEGNRIWTLLFGGVIPKELQGTTDPTYYTHYSSLSTVEANWELGSLGRGDTNTTTGNVYALVANVTGFKNNPIAAADAPQNNESGTIPGPLNSELYIPFYAPPNMSAVGPGGGPVFTSANLNTGITVASLGAPTNLTANNEPNPWSTDPGYDYSSGSLVIAPPSSTSSSAAGSSPSGTAAGGSPTPSPGAAGHNVAPALAAVVVAMIAVFAL